MKRMILSILGAFGQQCRDLQPGQNVQLTDVTAFVGGSVTVTCDAGYKLSTGPITMDIACVGSGTWNRTLPSCIRKLCPSISASPNMIFHPYSTRYTDDTVTVECELGFAFDVILTKPVTQRVTSLQNVTCLDNPISSSGSWSPLGTCSEIQCSEPPNVTRANLDYSSVAFGSVATYRFHSGYTSYNWFSVNLTCNNSATWDSTIGRWNELDFRIPYTMYDDFKLYLSSYTIYGENIYMYEYAIYEHRRSLGCFNLSCITVAHSSISAGGAIGDCLQFCQGNIARFTAVSNGTCYCMDDVPSCLKESAEVCNDYCRQYDPGSNPTHIPIYCGSATGQASVYYTYEGCLGGVDKSSVFREEVNGDLQNTCRERCRARESGYAGVVNSTCYCFNITDLAGSFDGECDGINIDMYDLGTYGIWTSSCRGLYWMRIRMAGMYYMDHPLRKEQCYFEDGTQCDFGWVGHLGHCYLSAEESAMDFMEARQFCHENNAELVSVLSNEEKWFLFDYRAVFGDIWGNTSDNNWWLGMADGIGSSLFMWLDGSMMRYSNFQLGEPSNIDKQCAVDASYQYWNYDDYKFGWSDGWSDDWSYAQCDEVHNVMCKRLAGWSSCLRLPSPPGERYERTHVNMSLTFCIELCKGQRSEYALVQNVTCLCTNVTDLTSQGTILNITECSIICPGQVFQNCGGHNNTYTYAKASGRARAASCEELQLFGLPEATFEIESASESIQHCGTPLCPSPWFSVESHCYKAHITTEMPDSSFQVCATDNAYSVSIETVEEIEELLGSMETIAIYASQTNWRIGLSGLSMHGGLYRWANGKQVNSSLWNNNLPATNKVTVAVASTNNNTWNQKAIGENVFICEKGSDYVGCFASVAAYTGASITSYYKMTIELCVERCRAEGMPYAYLTINDCYCWTNLTEPDQGDNPCLNSCSGQSNEICGGASDMMSVYDVSQYPAIATVCEDLSEAGIFLSGDYIVNGSLTYCHLIDGTECDTEWFGYNGNCYKHFPAEPARTRADVCRDKNATQVSLFSMDEWNIMAYFIKRIHITMFARVFSGISKGGYGLDVFISQDGLLVDPDLIDSGLLLPQDLCDAEGYISFRINQMENFPLDGGVICKQEKYVLGCYDKPAGITPILENVGSVELTLCRQLCAVGDYNVTLIGRDYCACASDTEINLFAPPAGACEEACFIHKDQLCGDGSVVWAHQTVWDEVKYARNCSSLYRAGIFFKSTYLLDDALSSQPRQEICGFSDTSSCPPTMLGNNGECFRFNKKQLKFNQAAVDCFRRDSYLFNPTNDTLNYFVYEFTMESGLLDGLKYWHAGLIPMFYNNSYVTSNGFFVDADLSNETNKPETHTSFDMEFGTWVESGIYEALPYICQTNKAFYGCQSMVNDPDVSYQSQWNSMTSCIQWCFGQNMQYAATSQTNCSCYATPPTMTSAYGSCDQSCPSVASQPCGGIKLDGSPAFSVMEIPSDIALASSCLDLYRYGVVQPGWYYIQTNAGSPVIRVACFGEGGPYQEVREENIKTRLAKTYKFWHSELYSSFTFPRTDVWKSQNTTYQCVGFELDDFHIITGVLTAGLRSEEEVSFVRSFGLRYYDDLIATTVTYDHNGSEELHPDCDDDVGMCLLYLSQPFITNKVLLYPKTWETSISVQMTFFGQSAYQFAYFDQYIGCFLDPHDEFDTINGIVDLTNCIDICEQLFYPFASIDEFDVCLCGSNGIENGKVEDSDCPSHSSGSYRTGLGSRRALYRTYEAMCEESALPELTNGTIANVVFPFHEGVYTYATLANYTCDEGYEYINGSVSETSSCQQNNQWTNLTKTRESISCPPFVVANGAVTFDSYQYQGVATVTCNEALYTENTTPSMNVTCLGNKQWTIVPTCTVKRPTYIDFLRNANKFRSQSGLLSEFKSRSRLGCAAKCSANDLCKGANYLTSASSDAVTCRLFTTAANPADLATEAAWEYMERNP